MSLRLKNWEYAKQRGRAMRLDAELVAHQSGTSVPKTPPTFSHDPTLQYYFNEAWQRVTASAIRRHLGISETEAGTDLISKIRRFKSCHLQPSQR